MRDTLVNLSLLLTLASPAFGAAVSKISPDATCGKTSAFTCQGSKWGNCCSQYNFCGSSDAYCGTGCQSAYGTCKTTTVIPTPSQGLKVSQNAACGSGVTCQGSKWGNCCSSHGWCGSSKDYCGTGCQALFGSCDAVSTSSTSRSATVRGASTSSTLATSRTTSSSTTSSSSTSSTSVTATTSSLSSSSSSTSSSSLSSLSSSSSSSSSTSTSTTMASSSASPTSASTQRFPTVSVFTIFDATTSATPSSSTSSSTQTTSSSSASSSTQTPTSQTVAATSTAITSAAPSVTVSTSKAYVEVFQSSPGCLYEGSVVHYRYPAPNLGPAGDYTDAISTCRAYCDSYPRCNNFFLSITQDPSTTELNNVFARCQLGFMPFLNTLLGCGPNDVAVWYSVAYDLVETGPFTITVRPTVSTDTLTSSAPTMTAF
ncbi:hypothetical protein PspLS_04097 [Pyricularia sp. CBS 133598]|nr:hypothetical protein PspLS_04097 [Pyricularia sp. CBS 133598]